MTTERYEVSDNRCGVIYCAFTVRDAFSQAKILQETTHQTCTVTVFDRMAHRGKPDTWGYAKEPRCWGVVLHKRD